MLTEIASKQKNAMHAVRHYARKGALHPVKHFYNNDQLYKSSGVRWLKLANQASAIVNEGPEIDN